jgi:hypothetical protein
MSDPMSDPMSDMSHAATARRIAPICIAIVALLLGACRSSAPIALPSGEPAAPPVATVETGVRPFEQRHRQAAAVARREGRLVDARWHWDVVLALRPDDADARREREEVDDAMHALAADRYAKARTAHQKGDADAAQRLYLDALQASPTHTAAADELRAIERERTRRGHVQALYAMRAAPARPPKPAAAGARGTLEARNEAEHASLIAVATEDALVPKSAATVSTVGTTVRDDDACRRAPLLEASDRSAAVRAWRECLKARPDDARATARLKALER